jgi:ATP-dependent Lon protease
LRALIPGWELRKLSGECFARSVGLKSDFFGDALLALRHDLEHDQRAARRIELRGTRVYKRNEDAVRSIASGLMKILFPHGQVTDDEFAMYCVLPAAKLRQQIWSQLRTLDAEYRQYESEIEYEILPD